MKKIKFSHHYTKLVQGERRCYKVKLMQVVRIDLLDLSQEMRDYDTDFGKFKLPLKGAYLMLIFQHPAGGLFTTIRRETPEKLEYYQGAVGDFFEVVINEN